MMWVTAHMSILEILLHAYKHIYIYIYIHMFFIYPGSGERWNNQQSDGPSSEPPNQSDGRAKGGQAGFLAPAPQAVLSNSNIAQIRCFLAPAPLSGARTHSRTSHHSGLGRKTLRPP